MLKLIYLTYGKKKVTGSTSSVSKKWWFKNQGLYNQTALMYANMPSTTATSFLHHDKDYRTTPTGKVVWWSHLPVTFQRLKVDVLRQKSSAMMPGLKGCLDWSLGGFFLCRMKCEISPLEVQNRQGGFFFLFFSDFWERRMWGGVFFRLFLREGGLIVNGFLHAKFEFDSSIKILCSSVLNITSYIGRSP